MAIARKRLRLGLAMERVASGLRVTDSFDLLDPIEFDEPAATILVQALAGAGPTEIAQAAHAAAGETLSEAEIRGFVKDLAAAGLFANAATDLALRRAFERHVLAGALIIPGQPGPAKLRLQARAAIEQGRAAMHARFGETPPLCRLEGALSPHGPMWATGDCAAHAYALLTPEAWPETFVIVGTSHYATEPAMLTLDVQTPLGRITSDSAMTAALAASRLRLVANDPSFLIEHSWGQDLPLLQLLAEEFNRPLRLVALQTGRMTGAQGKALGRLLRQLAFDQRKRVCLIASGDLSHFGASYRWRPAWLNGVSSTAEVLTRVRAHEAPILQAICDRDGAAFAAGVIDTSFCARAQVNALMEFATSRGELLHHRSVVNWAAVMEEPTAPWTSADKLFNGASIAFAHGRPRALPAGAPPPVVGLRLCQAVFMEFGREVQLLHGCDNTAYAFPREAEAILTALRNGEANLGALHATLSAHELPREVLEEFVAELIGAGLLHTHEAPSVAPSQYGLARAANAIAAARSKVPYYRKMLTSNRLADATPITSATVKQHWHAFLHDDAETMVAPEDRYVRRSSGSSAGDGLQTVEASAVFSENDLAGRLVGLHVGKTVSMNRPANLGLVDAKSWPAMSKTGFRASPGFNPSRIAPAIWDVLIERLQGIAPHTLEGEGAYVAAFARRCRALGVTVPALREVVLGHSYPWRIYTDAISRSLMVPVRYRYHSSELGLMAQTCELGAYHLVEPHYLYEVLHAGKWCKEGELGALVVTSLDAKIRPLIRYAIGDVVRLGPARCACGRPGRVVRFAGRLRHLIAGRNGALVTYEDLDAVVGAPQGLNFFHLNVAKATATLSLVPAGDRKLVDAAALKEGIEDLIDRKVRLRWCEHIELPQPRGKLLSVDTRADESAQLAQRFLAPGPRK